MPDARAAILARIREQLGESSLTTPAPDYAALPRVYAQRGSLSDDDCIAVLLERLLDYDAEVIELLVDAADTNPNTIASAVAAVLTRDHESVLLVPAGLDPAWLPSTADLEILRDSPAAALTRAQAVLTTCAGAIAETGTLLLTHNDPAQGRRALTLLPDHHLCILRRTQVVETVAEGFALIAAYATAPVTTISGPSATADIEMTRIRGVHGPRRLTVLLIP